MLKIMQLLLIVSIIHLTVFVPQAHAQAWTNAKCTYDDGGDQIATLAGIECIVANVINIAIRLVGIAAFVMFLMGGIKMVSSGGNPEAMGAAQQTMTLAITGIVLAVLSWFILVFIERFSGAQVTQFNFPIF